MRVGKIGVWLCLAVLPAGGCTTLPGTPPAAQSTATPRKEGRARQDVSSPLAAVLLPPQASTSSAYGLPQLDPPLFNGTPSSGVAEEAPQGGNPPPPRPPSGANAAGGLGGLESAFGGPGGAPGTSYGASWYPSRSVSGQGASLGLVRQNFSFGVPVWRDGGDSLSASIGIRESHFNTDAVLPDTGRPFPSDLWNVNFGLNYTHRFDNGWTGVLSTGFGSASDKPFHSWEETNSTISALLSVPAGNERDSWIFGVFYSSAGNLNFPLPVVAYSWKCSEQFQMNIGLPFSMAWKPTEDWTVTASYVPLTNVNVRATYRLSEGIHLYGGYENETDSYFLADRTDKNDRFFASEQRLIAGIRWDIWQRGTLDLNTGYSFGRHYGEGPNQVSDLHDRVDVNPGVFLGGSLRMRF